MPADAENYSSTGIEEYSNAVNTANHAAPTTYSRSSYSYLKPSQLEEYGGTSYTRGSSVGAWRPRFTTVDLDDEDLPVKSSNSSNRYSGYYGTSCK